MKNMYYLILLLLFVSFKAHSSCAAFEKTLVESMGEKVAARAEAKAIKEAWSGPEASAYRARYSDNRLTKADNRPFMTAMEADKAAKNGDVIYFNTHNSVQKKLNDEWIKDKGMVDAINNSFFTKFNKNLDDFPELKSKLGGKYVGFKDEDLRLLVSSPAEKEKIMEQLNALYRKTNAEFVKEFEEAGLSKLISPRTDELPDVSTWFLSGVGDSALEANMAARSARTSGFSSGSAQTVRFSDKIAKMHKDVLEIEKIRSRLAGSKRLVKSGMMEKLESGQIIPSEKMIDILRGTKLSECVDVADYYAKFRAKVRNQFNSDISDAEITQFTKYFQKTDSFSPPIYTRDPVEMDLAKAEHGIVSVDFTGVGVDNAYAQMKALSKVDYTQKNPESLMRDTFEKINTHVDEVTKEINESKRFFSSSSSRQNDVTKPGFSGDDGILMPKSDWSYSDKIALIEKLSKFKNPSKFRVTFAKTKFSNGKSIASEERSARIVRAEKIEKALREEVTGALKIPRERAKKMIFAIDVEPNAVGGQYNLLIGGERTTPEERKMILEAFTKSLKGQDGEKLGHIIEAY
ncbi:MAG: hypothetical protein K2Q18_05615 [Bdellovibrionales bacterium]|nr:hypothetical protein [Bdellovibrionales bacterium]